MEEGPRYAGGNGDEISLPAENFYLPGTGKVRQIDAAAASDASSRGLIGGYGRQGWKQFSGVNEQVLDRIFPGRVSDRDAFTAVAKGLGARGAAIWGAS